MKRKALCLILTMSFSWISASAHFKKYSEAELDEMLDNPEETLYIQRTNAAAYSKKTKKDFDPEELNLVGMLARRQFIREEMVRPLTFDDFREHAHDEGGHVREDDRRKSHRYETISRYVHQKLLDIYDEKILPKPIRVINNVGQVLALFEIYNCSMTEYLGLWGTLFEQNGYSGRYPYMRVWDIMVDGTMVSHGIKINGTIPVTYGPGEVSLLQKKERRFYNLSEGAMMLDYGRGFIPPAFVQGTIIPYKNNGDIVSFKDHFAQCLKSMARRHRN